MSGTDGFSNTDFMSTFGNRGNHNTSDADGSNDDRNNGNNGKQNSDKFDIRRSWVGNLFFGSKLEGAGEVRIFRKFFIQRIFDGKHGGMIW